MSYLENEVMYNPFNKEAVPQVVKAVEYVFIVDKQYIYPNY
jgi:hypothetical protein